ncbi:hypothetical protein HN858_00985 [Candidatus Falkowbacteria bacterium]|jgi:hypothetical protein|nr:hypothetical protein [Candidatus Falkowbacteria bacterium]MBT5503480.1 hypothetical protein [Candidatus Falkowbacteria bacterium]MBT6574071.1 hypothetical protein [Candidatus Falkowbacteria bacterium]MBT7348229.1 hypothetical protein [Candidatus Falkowbacteria bacterium]MBT7500208.1 hypothetical protein [Candidatus Falkowbacteria bacterium]
MICFADLDAEEHGTTLFKLNESGTQEDLFLKIPERHQLIDGETGEVCCAVHVETGALVNIEETVMIRPIREINVNECDCGQCEECAR